MLTLATAWPRGQVAHFGVAAAVADQDDFVDGCHGGVPPEFGHDSIMSPALRRPALPRPTCAPGRPHGPGHHQPHQHQPGAGRKQALRLQRSWSASRRPRRRQRNPATAACCRRPAPRRGHAAAPAREARLGWLASSTLKPQKNTNSSTASARDAAAGRPPAAGPAAPARSGRPRPGTPRAGSRGAPAGTACAPMTTNDASTAGRYTCQCCALGRPGLHQQGRNRHPHGQLHRMQHEDADVQPQQAGVGCSTSASLPRGTFLCCTGSGGIHQATTAMHDQRQRAGHREQARAGRSAPPAAARPPATARTSARCWRPPAPWPWCAPRRASGRPAGPSPRPRSRRRPAATRPDDQPVQGRRAQAAMKLPTANTSRPKMITRLRPEAVRGHAEGDLQDGLRQAVNAHGQADPGRVVAAGVARAPPARTPAAPGTGPACARRRSAASEPLARRSVAVMRPGSDGVEDGFTVGAERQDAGRAVRQTPHCPACGRRAPGRCAARAHRAGLSTLWSPAGARDSPAGYHVGFPLRTRP